MKKLLLLLTIIVINLGVYAGAPVTVKSGSAKVLKENEKAVVQLNFSNAKWDKDDDFKDWCGPDYEKRVNMMNTFFVSAWNEKVKGLQIVENQSDAKYKIVFDIHNFDRYSGVGWWGSYYIAVWGQISVVDIKSGKTVCLLNVEKAKGENDYNEDDRFLKTMYGLVEQISKLK